MKRLIGGVLAALLLGALVAGCGDSDSTTASGSDAATASGSDAATAAADGRLAVVATFSILGDVVRQVAGDRADVTTLVGPDGDAHTFEPTPQDGAAIADAAVVFENGLGFEAWLDDLYASFGSKATRVVATEGVTPGRLVEDGVEEEDPHAWQDVANVKLMTENVRDALVAADPDNADAYTANATAYLAELDELDAYVRKQIDTIPPADRKLVTNHDAFGYFANAYGFEIVGTALPVSTEAADPSAGEIAALVDQIKATGVRAVFAENIENKKVLDQIAAAAGVALGPALYSDALGPEGSDGATYLQMMRSNADAITGALGG